MNITDVILPVWVKPLALALAVAAVFGYGYHKGLQSGEADLTAFQAKVSTLASQQDLATAKRIVKQQEISSATETNLNKRLTAVDAKYRGLLRSANSGSSVVPPASQAPIVPNATTPNSVLAQQCNNVVNDYNQLASDCTKTTIIADEWQKWAVEQIKD